jgi:hypothetical protein
VKILKCQPIKHINTYVIVPSYISLADESRLYISIFGSELRTTAPQTDSKIQITRNTNLQPAENANETTALLHRPTQRIRIVMLCTVQRSNKGKMMHRMSVTKSPMLLATVFMLALLSCFGQTAAFHQVVPLFQTDQHHGSRHAALTRQYKQMLSPRSVRAFSPPRKTALLAGNDNDGNGEYQATTSYGKLKEGGVLLTLVLTVCAWLFTIPPEFRRAYMCPAEIYCNQDPTVCQECTTWGQWFDGVGEYYKGGGGIHWDFSVDPKTVEKNQNKMDNMFGDKQ